MTDVDLNGHSAPPEYENFERPSINYSEGAPKLGLTGSVMPRSASSNSENILIFVHRHAASYIVATLQKKKTQSPQSLRRLKVVRHCEWNEETP